MATSPARDLRLQDMPKPTALQLPVDQLAASQQDLAANDLGDGSNVIRLPGAPDFREIDAAQASRAIGVVNGAREIDIEQAIRSGDLNAVQALEGQGGTLVNTGEAAYNAQLVHEAQLRRAAANPVAEAQEAEASDGKLHLLGDDAEKIAAGTIFGLSWPKFKNWWRKKKWYRRRGKRKNKGDEDDPKNKKGDEDADARGDKAGEHEAKAGDAAHPDAAKPGTAVEKPGIGGTERTAIRAGERAVMQRAEGRVAGEVAGEVAGRVAGRAVGRMLVRGTADVLLGGGLAMIWNPVGWVMLGLGALALGADMYLNYKDTGSVSGMIAQTGRDIWNGVLDAGRQVGRFFSDLWHGNIGGAAYEATDFALLGIPSAVMGAKNGNVGGLATRLADVVTFNWWSRGVAAVKAGLWAAKHPDKVGNAWDFGLSVLGNRTLADRIAQDGVEVALAAKHGGRGAAQTTAVNVALNDTTARTAATGDRRLMRSGFRMAKDIGDSSLGEALPMPRVTARSADDPDAEPPRPVALDRGLLATESL